MKIEKLSNSTYRLRKMYHGKTYTVITDYKPTQKEAVTLMAEKMQRTGTRGGSMTFADAARDYIDVKNNVLSPATVREYTSTINRIPESFANMRLSDIEQSDVQRFINAYAKNHAPKTVANMNGFVSTIIREYANVSFRINLPQRQIKPEYVPTESDVQRILDRASGTQYEIPFWLALYGLRRSEICALDVSDLDGNVLTINKAKVKNKESGWIIKPYPKNVSSNRTVLLAREIADKIREQGFAYTGHPGAIYKALQRYQNELGIPNFPLHKFRHYFCSVAHAEGIPDEYIQAMGGWATDYCLKKVYRHAFDTKKIESQEQLNNFLSRFLSTSDATR